jgi:nucleotide-binding universal stress UspA family protein
MSHPPISKVLAPVDFSSCSRAALELACKLALPFQARVEVLFVRPLNAVTPGGGPEVSPEEQLAAARAELHRFAASVPGSSSLELTERIEFGDARERIVAVAESGGFDLIVLGTHGRTGRPRSLAGSIAESVVRTAPCPVTTVRESL